jgi:hypothetical protein
MNIAFFASPGTWAPLLGLLRRFAPARLPTSRGQATFVGESSSFAPDSVALQNQAARRGNTMRARHAQRRPLRVVRIMEAGQAPALVGRMVISGRMADVCAELDRLVACEAARQRNVSLMS